MPRYNHEDQPVRSRIDGASWESIAGHRRASPSAKKPAARPTGRPAAKATPGQRAEASAPFSGKRGSRRFPAVLPVEIRSSYLMLRGETVDLSRDGFRARLNEASIQRLGDSHNAFGLFDMIERHFAEGVEAHFPRHGVRGPARVVRLSTMPKEGADVFLGFRFLRALSDEEWSRLFETTR